MLAWHFMRKDRRLQYGDNRLAVKGRWLSVDDSTPLYLCYHGMHASPLILEAYQYAPGPILARVELGGEIINHYLDDKVCAQKRKILWWINSDKVFRKAALRTVLGSMSTKQTRNLPKEVKRYIQTLNENDRRRARKTIFERTSSIAPMSYLESAIGDPEGMEAYGSVQALSEPNDNTRITSMVVAEAKRLGVYCK